MKNKRISKDEYYLGIAKAATRKAVCFRRVSAAVIVLKDQIVSTGYTGAPRKTRGCLERKNCMRDELKIPSGQRYELCRSVHAEENAVINAARAGVSLLGGDMYIYACSYKKKKRIDAFPCFICKKMIINAGINRVICSKENGGFDIHNVKEWVKEWQNPEKDIIDDKQQYGKGFKVEKRKEKDETSR